MSREEEDTAFCDKKLLAINHLYNDSSEAILSVRGTVRGIKNRVRAGIRTFAPEKVIRYLTFSIRFTNGGGSFYVADILYYFQCIYV